MSTNRPNIGLITFALFGLYSTAMNIIIMHLFVVTLDQKEIEAMKEGSNTSE